MDLRSASAFWAVNDGLIATYPRLDGDARCEVAVLGGGITGALIAHHLVEAGFDTLVLDRRDVGCGSTAASTALLQYEIDVLLRDLAERYDDRFAERAYRACAGAIDTLERLAAGCGADVGFSRRKSLYLATRRRDVKILRDECERRRAIGLDVVYLDADDIEARFPFRRPAALLSSTAAQVDPYAFTHALLRNASARGLRVYDRTTVTNVDATESGVTLHTADGCIVSARHLVFATGYETRDFLRPHVAELVSTFAIATEPGVQLQEWGEEQCMIWEHGHPYLYLRTTPDGRVIIGGEDEPFRDPERRDRMIARKADKLAERLHALFPQMHARVEFAWAGTFGETKDGLAYIGAHSDWPSCFFALGYGGNGITYSVIAAGIIRDALLGRTHEHVDLFRFDR